MKYHQPYGITDPNAPYINGNPSTGTMGSIPPAASIEYPQREIVNLITDSGIAANDADLHQLAKAVQNGWITAAPDTGTVNQLFITLTPPPLAYTFGMVVRVLILFTNTGPSVLNVNGLGALPVIRSNGGPMAPGDLYKGEIATFINDGLGHWQKLGLGAQPGDVTLTAARDLYVNATSGNDAFDGLTPQTAFQTGDRAMRYIMRTNLNGYNITVHFADGTYGGFTMQRPLYASSNGYGSIYLIGNVTSPANCVVSAPSGSAIGCNLDVGSYIIRGFKVQTAAGYGIVGLGAATTLQMGMIEFGNCGGGYSHCHAQAAINGWLGVGGGWTDNIRITGSAQAHITCADVGRMNTQLPPLIIANPVSFPSGFVSMTECSHASAYYNGITGAANVAGPKFSINGCSYLSVGGQGPNYLPGNSPGVLSYGGQIQ